MTEKIDPVEVIYWSNSGPTGASAEALVAHAIDGTCNGSYPHDAGDFERCERAMDMIPGLRDHLPEMANVNAYWGALVPAWGSIEAAPDRTAAIKAIIGPIQDADPTCARIAGATLTPGNITFTTDEFNEIAKAARKGRAPMKDDADWAGHNSKAYNVTANELRQFIERIEHLEAEKREIADQIKEVYAELKGRGYDSKAIRKLVSLRKKDPEEIQEEDAILDLYKQALGMV